MGNNDNIGKKPGRAISVLICLFLVIVSFQCLPGCSLLRYSETVRVERDTTMVHHRDSIYFRDSIYIREWLKGDTVYIREYRDRYLYRDMWRDSVVTKEVHDTTTVERRVEKELTPIQKAKMKSFWWLLAGLVLSLLWIFRKYWLPILKFIR